MEKELHIIASAPQQIQSCKETFFTNNGYGTIELTPYGDYLLNTVDITDAAARRTNEYKSAYKEVTANMLQAYEENTRAYTYLHEDMPSVESVVKLKNDLMTLSPQKYERGHFDFNKNSGRKTFLKRQRTSTSIRQKPMVMLMKRCL